MEYLIIAAIVVGCIIIFLHLMFKRDEELHKMCAYANIDQQALENAEASNELHAADEHIIERVAMQTNLHMYSLIRLLRKNRAHIKFDDKQFEEMIGMLESFRPKVFYEEGNFKVNVYLIDFDYSVLEGLPSEEKRSIRMKLEDVVTGVRYIFTQLEQIELREHRYS